MRRAAIVLWGCALLAQTPRNPAAWGSNHASKPVPEFVHGDECLFCHRNDIGPGWQKNAHQRTVRQVEDAPELRDLLARAPGAEFFLGSRHRVRFLKKAGYGRFALLNTQAALADGKVQSWESSEKPAWDAERFGNRCAGCHTTGVDSRTKTFAAFGLDCYTCHGDVNLEHTNDTPLIWLSKKRRGDAQAITSICGQCHLRGARSKSSGLPYPNNFVAADNLFQDLDADFARADDAQLNPGDRHVWRNARDVVVKGEDRNICLSCHRLHANSTRPHRLAGRSPICFDCHDASKAFKEVKAYAVHSAVCEY